MLRGDDGATGPSLGGIVTHGSVAQAWHANKPPGRGPTAPLVQLCFLLFPLFKLAGDVYRSTKDVFHI